jgi:uncharacterized tellurite resistance protein B-like protein
MLERIRALVSAHPGLARHSADPLHLAVAALLMETAGMDGRVDERERQRIGVLLGRRFGLGPAEAAGLVEAAACAVGRADRLFPVTRQVVERLDYGERVELMEMLWDVAYADGSIHHLEANLLRRLAGLVYVDDRDSGGARKRVEARRAKTASGNMGED